MNVFSFLQSVMAWEKMLWLGTDATLPKWGIRCSHRQNISHNYCSNSDHSNDSILTCSASLWEAYKLKKKLHGLSPRANYTDRATAACRRSDCQLVRIEGATWSAWQIPPAVFSRFSRREPLLFYQVAPQLYSLGWVDPVPDPLLFFLVVPGIEPGPPNL
jgi:hypothetical protein